MSDDSQREHEAESAATAPAPKAPATPEADASLSPSRAHAGETDDLTDAALLDDDDLLSELDAEFAELTSEIDRITALPQEWAKETQIQQLKMLRDEWLKKARQRKDRPEWHAKVEQALSSAFEKVVREGTSVDMDGRMSFKLDQQTLGSEAMPVLKALFEGLTKTLAEKVITLDLKGVHTPRPTPKAEGTAETAADEPGASPANEVETPPPSSAQSHPAPTAVATPPDEAGEPSTESSQAMVQIKLDLGSILGALFKQVTPKSEDD